MKKPSTDLYDLIQSMTPQQKINFKVFYKKTASKDSVYMRLFEAISSQKEYDESKILKEFNKTNGRKWLTTAKVRLFNMIIRTITLYESDLDTQIQEKLHAARIFQRKGLFKLAYQLIKQVRKLTEQYEKFELMPQILDAERALVSKFFFKKKRLSEHIKLNKEHEKLIQNIHELSLNKAAMYLSISYGAVKGLARNKREINQLRKQLKLPEKEPLKDKSKIYYYATYANFYRLVGNFEESYKFSQQTVSTIELRKEFIEDNIRMYIASLHNLVLVQQEAKKLENAKVNLEKLKNILPGYKSYKTQASFSIKKISGMTKTELGTYLESVYMIETNQYLLTGEFEKGVKRIDAIKADLERFSHLTYGNKTVSVIIHYNFAYLYFGVEKYEEALDWLNIVLNNESSYLQEDLFAITKVANLIFHYELGNENLLEHFVRSTYRFLYKRKRLYKIEDAILSFIRKKLPETRNQKDMIKHFSDLKKDLEKIAEEPYQARVMDHFDFISWLESKISKKPFLEVIRQKKKTQV